MRIVDVKQSDDYQDMKHAGMFCLVVMFVVALVTVFDFGGSWILEHWQEFCVTGK